MNVSTAPTESVSYVERVWARLRQRWIARVGLWCISGLVVLATVAPVLSHEQPFYWADAQGLKFPWFRSLFNRLVFENGVDIYFNLLLVGVPFYVVGYYVLRSWRKRGGASWPTRSPLLFLVLLHQGAFLVTSPETWVGVDNPLHYTERTEHYAASEVEELERKGEVETSFPVLPYGFRSTDPGNNLKGPSPQHWLGTDTEGRDVLSRMIYGTRISLTIGVVAVSIYVTIGIILGALAGYFGGKVDLWVSRLIEVMICFPSFFLILTIAALIEQRSIFHVMLIIGLTSWTGVARLIRAEFLKHRNLEYTQAAVALGFGAPRIIFRHILPNAIAPVLVSATFGIATAILVESSLAFLGIGDVTVASWGDTLNSGRVEGKLWLVLAPGCAIFFVVSIFNLVGESLRDALDPKLDA